MELVGRFQLIVIRQSFGRNRTNPNAMLIRMSQGLKRKKVLTFVGLGLMAQIVSKLRPVNLYAQNST